MSWAAEELRGVDLGDGRLNRRAIDVLGRLADKPPLSIPDACEGWSETKAAYRFFGNGKVSPERILAPHTQATLERARGEGVVLCVGDTTELSFTGKNDIGGLGPLTYEAERGMYLHPLLAVSPGRVPLGLLNALMWSRDPEGYGRSAEQARAPIDEKESSRWLENYRHVSELQRSSAETEFVFLADREADIYEIFAESREEGRAPFVIRSNSDRRLAGGGKLRETVAATPALGTLAFDLPARPARRGKPARKARRVFQKVHLARVRLKPPDGKAALGEVELTVVLVRETHPPQGEEPVVWYLLTPIPVETLDQAQILIEWYLCRWQIEVFFRILKSGCKVERLQLEAIDRLENALAIFLIVAWRVLLLTMVGRNCPDLPCDAVFTTEEWRTVYILKYEKPPKKPPPLQQMVRLVSTFGGFLNRKRDGEPGPKALWTGLQHLRVSVIAIEAVRCG